MTNIVMQRFGRDRVTSRHSWDIAEVKRLTLNRHSILRIATLQNECCFSSSGGHSELARPLRPFSHHVLNSDRLSDAHVRRDIGHCRSVSAR